MSQSLKILTIAFLVSSFEEPMFRMFTALYVADIIKVGDFEWGLVNTASIATTIILGFPFGKLIDKIQRKKGVLLAYCIFIPSTVLFIFSWGLHPLLLAFILFSVGGCLIMPAYSALQADMIPRDKRGRIMGTIGTLNILATIPASAIGGFLYGFNPTYPFIFAIALGVTVSLIVLLGVEEPKTREA
jgi:MFS family permease